MLRRILSLIPMIVLAARILPAQQSPTHPGSSPAPAAHASAAPLYELAALDLSKLELDPAKVAPVQGYMLQRDVAGFSLNEGKIYLTKPIAGRVRAALFIGSGEFNFTPPVEAERKQLARCTEKEDLQEEFTSLFFYFADSTLEELSTDLTFTNGTVPDGAAALVEDGLQFMGRDYGFDPAFMYSLLNGERSPMFGALVRQGKQVPFFFVDDPYEEEEIRLLQGDPTPSYRYALSVINQFHKKEDYETGTEVGGDKTIVAIDAYRLDAKISSGLAFSASASMDLKQLQPGGPWACFYLYPELQVDSARWEGSESAAFFKAKDGDNLWIRCDSSAVAAGRKLQLWYHGDVLMRQQDWITLKSSIGWYPSIGYKRKSRFDLTFHTPSGLKFVSVGENVSNTSEGEERISHWLTYDPIRNASFNIGPFSERVIPSDSLPPITVYMTKASHSQIDQGITSGSNMDARVGDDVKNAIALFTYLYGPCSAKKIFATEIPEPHGEAFPGLIHLNWKTFQRDDESGFDQLFRAHEVAHQWWGIGLDFQTYHDQWLSEAFAEYSGLMYMQAALKRNDKFFKMLRQYRDKIMNNRKSFFGKGQEAGPIWLGYRTQSSHTAGDYDLIIYQKGAWVLHMLRGLMLDNRTMKEDKFRETMRDFYQTFSGQEATTEDFRKIVEKHVGTDMGWFFDEWVYGTAVPSYSFSYKVEDAPEGKYQVTVRVDQKDVPDDFKMYVPLKLDFGDKGAARDRILVAGPHTEIKLPLMPYKPKEVVFNDLDAVLCQVDEVSWN